jgi:dihydrofolate reductase
MRKIIAFENTSLDGFFVDAQGDMSWAHVGSVDDEFNAFVSDNNSGEAEFIFGRKTYELMASYWPTLMAQEQNPIVAEMMNARSKHVFSKTLNELDWSNSHLRTGDLISEVRNLKESAGPDIVILGSGSIVSQLSEAALIDEYHVVVNPIVLGTGRTLFDGRRQPLPLKLGRVFGFKNGKVFLSYAAAAS